MPRKAARRVGKWVHVVLESKTRNSVTNWYFGIVGWRRVLFASIATRLSCFLWLHVVISLLASRTVEHGVTNGIHLAMKLVLQLLDLRMILQSAFWNVTGTQETLTNLLENLIQREIVQYLLLFR